MRVKPPENVTPLVGAAPNTKLSASKRALDRKVLTELTVKTPRGSSAPEPTSPANVMSPSPASRVRSKVPLTVLLKRMSPLVSPVVSMETAAVARMTGLLKVILAPSPSTPDPPPLVPPAAVIVLPSKVTAKPPDEFRVMVPAFPPSELFRVLAPPEVSKSANPIVPVVVVTLILPPTPPAPALEAPPKASRFPDTVIFPLTLVRLISPPVLPAPVLLEAPVVTRSPTKSIFPVPLALILMAPELTPVLLTEVVLIVCAAARSTPPTPAVKVALPPAVSIPAFRSRVAPSKVTFVVGPEAVIRPSTWTSPPVPLDRITTESWN